jgi:S-adenosylmethionine-diacylgycerolhomoserine-N-methlytransferase
MNGDGAAAGAAIERYYRLHSRIYDATRWSFLFGRRALMACLAQHVPAPRRILEVGAGTGRNLVALAEVFPQAAITGVDASADMLAVAARNLGSPASRVELVHRRYDAPLRASQPFDLVVFSYALSMFNPGWSLAIDYARQDLAAGGCIAVVDFHASPSKLFKRWMAANHVRMNGHLLPALATRFDPCYRRVRHAYGGLWSYGTFIGRKSGH